MWSPTGEATEELLEFTRTPARPGTTPTAITYGPIHSKNWSILYPESKHEKVFIPGIIRNDPGVYEVRYRLGENTPYTWLYVGNSGGKGSSLQRQGAGGRIRNLLRYDGAHSHRADILEYMAVIEGLTWPRNHQRDEQAWKQVEIRWCYCHKKDIWLLEYLLHLRHEPIFPDEEIFGDAHFFPAGHYPYFWYRG